MADEDYGPEDIAHVECNLDLWHEPSPHVKVRYTVHLKNGETREHLEGTIEGLPAADAAISVLSAKYAVHLANGDIEPKPVEDDGQRDWRNRGR
jgi:hypothetical protein